MYYCGMPRPDVLRGLTFALPHRSYVGATVHPAVCFSGSCPTWDDLCCRALYIMAVMFGWVPAPPAGPLAAAFNSPPSFHWKET